MALRVLDIHSLREERRSKPLIEVPVEYRIGDKVKTITARIVHGEMEVMHLTRPVGEMLTTPQGLETFVQKVVIDLQLGREQVPLLYKPLYRTITDANLTEFVEVQGIVSGAQIVFLEHAEGEEVRLGTRTLGTRDTVPIVTYAAGFTWTEDLQEYDKTWQLAELSRALGEAYNALCNHLHLYPLLSFSYPAKNKTGPVTTEPNRILNIRATIRQALIQAAADKDPETGRGRQPTILICNSVDRWDIEEALQRLQVGGTIYPAISQIDTIVVYDGWSVRVGDVDYTYPGCPPNKVYLVDPRRYLVELVKHDLRVDAVGPDLLRLMAGGVVARARRGLYAAPEKCVQEVTLPA